MLVSELKEKLPNLSKQLKSILNIDDAPEILIAEDLRAYSEEHDYYIEPYSFIIDDTKARLSQEVLNSFRDFLRKELDDVGIEVYSKHFLNEATKQEIENDDLFDSYKSLIDTAIVINELDVAKEWRDQFNDKKKLKNTERGNEFGHKDKKQKLTAGDSPLREQEQFMEICGLTKEEFEKFVNSDVPESIKEKMVHNIVNLRDKTLESKASGSLSQGRASQLYGGQEFVKSS